MGRVRSDMGEKAPSFDTAPKLHASGTDGPLHHMRRNLAIACIALALLWVEPFPLWSRLMGWPSTTDLTKILSTAPMVFRATVAHVSVREDMHRIPWLAVARLHVDRWYR